MKMTIIMNWFHHSHSEDFVTTSKKALKTAFNEHFALALSALRHMQLVNNIKNDYHICETQSTDESEKEGCLRIIFNDDYFWA